MKKVLITAFVCLIAMVLFVTGCSSKINDANEKSSAEVAKEKVSDEYDDIVVETMYGNLYFPGKWEECLYVEQSDIESAVKVDFSAKVEENVILLFSVVIGDSDDNAAGILTDDEGKQRNVAVSIEDLSENELISQDDLELLYRMQEDLNYLIDNLK